MKEDRKEEGSRGKEGGEQETERADVTSEAVERLSSCIGSVFHTGASLGEF